MSKLELAIYVDTFWAGGINVKLVLATDVDTVELRVLMSKHIVAIYVDKIRQGVIMSKLKLAKNRIGRGHFLIIALQKNFLFIAFLLCFVGTLSNLPYGKIAHFRHCK